MTTLPLSLAGRPATDSLLGMSMFQCETNHSPDLCVWKVRATWVLHFRKILMAHRVETNPWCWCWCSMICQPVTQECESKATRVLRNPECRILVLSLWFKTSLHWLMMLSYPEALRAVLAIGIPTLVGWITVCKISGPTESYLVRFNCINATIQFCQRSV